MQNSNLYNFLSRQIQENRSGAQSTALVKEVQKIVNKYFPTKEREKFIQENYGAMSETKLKITLDK